MKNLNKLPIQLMTFCFFFLIVNAQTSHKYVGVQRCKMCHSNENRGNQFKIWIHSNHSKAFETLKTQKANRLAKKMGIKKNASKANECLKCHVTAFGVKKELITKIFNKENGIQCETCHGAGSDYSLITVMTNKNKAVAAGLHIYGSKEKIKTLCQTCHNKQSPNFKKFDFEKMWDKIKHYRKNNF